MPLESCKYSWLLMMMLLFAKQATSSEQRINNPSIAPRKHRECRMQRVNFKVSYIEPDRAKLSFAVTSVTNSKQLVYFFIDRNQLLFITLFSKWNWNDRQPDRHHLSTAISIYIIYRRGSIHPSIYKMDYDYAEYTRHSDSIEAARWFMVMGWWRYDDEDFPTNRHIRCISN